MIKPIALACGGQLLAEAATGTRAFAAGLWFPVGSRHETPRERGFAHFTEHLLFKGTDRRTAFDIAREIDRVGGYLNAFTERDLLCLHCVTPASYWKLGLDLLVDLAFCSTFPAEEVEREREVIVSEILAARDDPEEAAHDRFIELVWPGDPLARKIAGEPEDIEAAARDELFDFYRRQIVPERLLASAAGPIDPELVAEEFDSLLGRLPVRVNRLPPPPRDTTPHFEAAQAIEAAPLSQVYLFEALPLDPPYDPSDYYVLSVLNGALGESMSSRLFQGLREREGLCYSVYSAFSLSKTEGLWLAQASSSSGSFPRLLGELDRELDRFGSGEGLTSEELSESISRIAGSFELSLDDPEFRMKRLARQALYGDGILEAEETRERILAVDAASVASMAERLFSGKARARFAYGRKTKAGIKALGLEAKGIETQKGKPR